MGKLHIKQNLAAVKKLEEGNFGLAYENNSGKNAAGWGKIFSDYIGSEGGGGTVSEAVLVTLYNNRITSRALTA